MAKRTARDFSRKQIWNVATKYAFTENQYSHEYFERDFEISTGTFYTLLEKAVVENIVDDETVSLMARKAKYNSNLKAGEQGAKRSERHYDYLIKKRAIYMLPKNEAISITIKYCDTVRNKREFARENCITTKLLDRSILKCIVECWISDEIVMRLKKRSLRRNPDALEFWERIEKLRENNTKNQG